MEAIRKRYLIIIGTMVLTSAIVNFLNYEAYHEADAGIQAIKKIPVDIGKWKGKDVFLEEQIYEILETRSIIHRNYASDMGNAFLSLVYHPETKMDFHAPEYCFGAQGVELVKTAKSIEIVNEGKVIRIKLNQLIYKKPGFDELVYYFYKSGEFIGSSYFQLRLALSMNKLSNKGTSGSLVRVSTPIINGNSELAASLLSDFIEDSYPHLLRI